VEKRLGFESIVPSALNLGTESLFHFLSGVGGPGGWLDFGRGVRIFFSWISVLEKVIREQELVFPPFLLY
jgi:hypothetical protein